MRFLGRTLKRREWSLALVPLLTACAPSLEALHESHVQFERCYADDENPRLPLSKKSACWRDYATRFGEENQDKKRYAESRASDLARLEMMPTDDALMRAAPGSSDVHVSAPAPTSAERPPPTMAP
jgi:hypothetical protein